MIHQDDDAHEMHATDHNEISGATKFECPFCDRKLWLGGPAGFEIISRGDQEARHFGSLGPIKLGIASIREGGERPH